MRKIGVFMNWKNKMSQFLYGRYGVDQLSKFLLIITLILCVVSIFSPMRIGSFISTLVFILIIYTYYRMLSKNIYKRASENEKYLKITSKWRKKINTEKKISSQRKYYRFYKCPGCGQKIRVPKGHGKIQIRCPKCDEKFIKKS